MSRSPSRLNPFIGTMRRRAQSASRSLSSTPTSSALRYSGRGGSLRSASRLRPRAASELGDSGPTEGAVREQAARRINHALPYLRFRNSTIARSPSKMTLTPVPKKIGHNVASDPKPAKSRLNLATYSNNSVKMSPLTPNDGGFDYFAPSKYGFRNRNMSSTVTTCVLSPSKSCALGRRAAALSAMTSTASSRSRSVSP